MSLRRRRGKGYDEPTRLITMVLPESVLNEMDEYVLSLNTSRTRFIMELFNVYKGKPLGELRTMPEITNELVGGLIESVQDDSSHRDDWKKVYLNG